jgi:hypothetical protein
MELLSRDERFKATVSAMNTILIQKGIYTQKEFEIYFCQWAEAETKKRSKQSANTTHRSLEPA